MKKPIELNWVHELSVELKEALAFYTSYGITTIDYTIEERERHYGTLEQAGYLAKVELSHA